jgi:hypothetical protein
VWRAARVVFHRVVSVKVQVSVYCDLAVQTCTIKDGFSHGFLLALREGGAKPTAKVRRLDDH